MGGIMRPRKPSSKERKTTKFLNKEFTFEAFENYDQPIYDFSKDKSVKINPIPIIVKLKNDDGTEQNKRKLKVLMELTHKELRRLSFSLKHGDLFVINESLPRIAFLLGVKYSVSKLLEKGV